MNNESCPHRDTICASTCILKTYLEKPADPNTEPSIAADTWTECPDYDTLVAQYRSLIEASRKYMEAHENDWMNALYGQPSEPGDEN